MNITDDDIMNPIFKLGWYFCGYIFLLYLISVHVYTAGAAIVILGNILYAGLTISYFVVKYLKKVLWDYQGDK